jgi:hypothetical protein
MPTNIDIIELRGGRFVIFVNLTLSFKFSYHREALTLLWGMDNALSQLLVYGRTIELNIGQFVKE